MFLLVCARYTGCMTHRQHTHHSSNTQEHNPDSGTAQTTKQNSDKVPGWVRILIASTLVVTWIAISGIGGPYFGKISQVSTNSSTDFLPSTAESTRVVQEQKDFYPSESVPAILVFTGGSGEGGTFTDGQKTYLDSLPAKFADNAEYFDGSSPVIYSQDGQAAEIVVPVKSSVAVKDGVKKARELTPEEHGLTRHITGPAGFAADLVVAFGGIDGILLLVALAVVFLILLIVYRSPILPFVVLFSSVAALSGAIFVIWHLANAGVVKINGQVQGILLILVVGAATDYALLYVARYREALTRHRSRFDATAKALKNSFEPILASGGTVIAGLLCLLFSSLASNQALGPVAATGIVLSMLASLTFLPAALALLGRAAFWPALPKLDSAQGYEHKLSTGLWARIADTVAAKPRRIWIGFALVLAIFAALSGTFHAEGVRQSDLVLGASGARDGQNTLAKHFPGGSGSPANIILPADKLDETIALLDGDAGVASTAALAQDSPSGTVPVGRSAENLPPAFASIKPTESNGRVMLQTTLTDAPDSTAAEETVKRLRQDLHGISSEVLVGGTTAATVDTLAAAEQDRATIIPIVLAVITVILMLLLRSVLAPLILLAVTVLSYLATLGVSALLFNHVLHMPGADPTVPLYGFVFLVALGIDYTIFLMTRVREETLSVGTREGMRRGLIITGGVITSAGVVLATTFAALAVIPLIFLVQLAFIVAFGVLLDAILVRAFLVPALVEDLGGRIWWPSRLR